jgi:hypothetical protein
MPTADDQAKHAWVRRVLGVDFHAQPDVSCPEPGALNAIFVAAKDAVDAQVSALQAAFRGTDHPLSAEIADRGLIGLSRSLFVPLQTALREYGGAAPAKRADAARALKAALADVESFVATDKVLPHLERNPFGVAFTAREAWGNAVREMRAALASQPNV